MEKFEKLADFKKSVKAGIRGAVKAGVFGADGVFTVVAHKCSECKQVCVTVENGAFTLNIGGEVSTRVFNKVTPEFFAPIVAQFEKLAKVEKINVTIVE